MVGLLHHAGKMVGNDARSQGAPQGSCDWSLFADNEFIFFAGLAVKKNVGSQVGRAFFS